jgi:hypothetical protein
MDAAGVDFAYRNCENLIGFRSAAGRGKAGRGPEGKTDEKKCAPSENKEKGKIAKEEIVQINRFPDAGGASNDHIALNCVVRL